MVIRDASETILNIESLKAPAECPTHLKHS